MITNKYRLFAELFEVGTGACDDGGWLVGWLVDDDGGWLVDDDGGWLVDDDGGWLVGWLVDDDGG